MKKSEKLIRQYLIDSIKILKKAKRDIRKKYPEMFMKTK